VNPPLLRCAAVVACRNEAHLLAEHLPVWISEGLEIVVIDHSSLVKPGFEMALQAGT
jgi:hypothetical protein